MEDVVVELNVGGVVMGTLQSTLTSRVSSRLASTFGKLPASLPQDKEGRGFVDRDPVAFSGVLNYLRLRKAGELWEAALPKDPRSTCRA